MNSNPALRIARLRALIDHPRTGPGEKDAAQRMLDRILGKHSSDRPSGDRTYGARHDRAGRHAGIDTIVEMIRFDIACARTVGSQQFGAPQSKFDGPVLGDPIGDAPEEISFGVEALNSMSIAITLGGVPQQWGWSTESGIAVASPALRALADELADIMYAYNRDGSDIDKRFFGSVRAEGKTLVW
ncbi:hypothetical protein [Rhodococcus sovatensis]|uniref:DUF2786 domain-containing protein n=1 Tax=Rhodococcus sovatensis TaxID=1805840 RepID=A0ABZ2PN78_9NOCA